ncbi:MAG: polysaccharide biosynthesis protein [Bacteroidetes bacterium]|nr:polysaccharide biosynthesis protein [Bacteroidota bacterium]
MSIKKLAGETAIYGIPTIIGRLLYFALTPFYTNLFPEDEYGIVTNLFALMGFLMVIFTYRMEISYFRFGTDDKQKAKQSFDTAATSIILSTIVLSILLLPLAPHIASIGLYPERSNLVMAGIIILALDALCEMPYSRLRLEGQPLRFAFIRLTNIIVNLGLNLFFLLFCPYVLAHSGWSWLHPFIQSIYDPTFGIGYIFLSNLIASLIALVLLSPLYFSFSFRIDWKLWKQMFFYAFPLIIVGFSYVINEMLDRQLFPILASGSPLEKKTMLGEYGACYKLAMILALFTQAFRYGAEPFFFKQKTAGNAKKLYAEIAKYFAIIGAIGFLAIMLYIDYVKYFIDEDYWEALGVVPILLLANLFLGLYYNLSVWYKLIDKTIWGAYISVGGAVVTIGLNLWWIPIFGYVGSAWATLICYFGMTVASYYFGKKHLPIPYEIGKILFYISLAIIGYFLNLGIRNIFEGSRMLITSMNTLILITFLTIIYLLEKKNVQRYFGTHLL